MQKTASFLVALFLAAGGAATAAPRTRTAQPRAMTPRADRAPRAITPRTYQPARTVAPRVYRAPRAAAPHVYQAPRTIAPRLYHAPRAVAPRAIAPRVYRAPHAVAPRVYRAPHAIAPRVYRAPHAIAPRVYRAPHAIAPRVYRAPHTIAPRVYRAPHTIAPHVYRAPHAAAPRAYHGPHALAPRAERLPHTVTLPRSVRNQFVRYYTPQQLAPAVVRPVVFRQYAPRRIFLPQPVRVVQQYVVQPRYITAPAATVPVGYVYTGYAPAPQYVQMPGSDALPIVWNAGNAYGDGDSDDDGGGMYAPVAPVSYGYSNAPYAYANNPYGYANPWGYSNPFGNASLQGLVIGSTNAGVLVLTQNLTPVFVNTSIARQNGYVQGNLQAGTFVNVYGYNSGSEFIATAIV